MTSSSPADAPRGDDEVGPRGRALLSAAQRLDEAVRPDTPPMIVPLRPEEAT